MAVPPGVWCDRVVTVRTASLLAFPEGKHASLSFEGGAHRAVQALFAVGLPTGVVGIRPARDLDMARDRETVSREEVNRSTLSGRAAHVTREHPVSGAQGGEVAGLHPLHALVWVAAFGPAPQRWKIAWSTDWKTLALTTCR